MSDRIKKIISQLENNTTLDIAKNFLKEHGVSHSCSGWASLLSTRISPAVEQGLLDENKLISFLREVEEHGKQHIFVYKCSKTTAKELCTESHLIAVLKQLNLESLRSKPNFLDIPNSPTIVDARIESGKLVIKIADFREIKIFQGQHLDVAGTKLTMTYQYERSRSTSVAVLHDTGVLEIRVSSKSNWSKYADDVYTVWGLIDPFIGKDRFHEVSLVTAKNKLGDTTDKATADFLITNRKIVDAYGASFEGSAGDPDKDLRDHKRMRALDSEMDDGTYCDSAKVCLKKNENGLPSENMRILLGGRSNEFAITAKCTKQDYDYAFNRLWKLNRKIS
ncbi:MAG TPA: hypothetical protein VIZ65_00420 [Cellvibrionaceae bacterium]